MLLDHLSLNSVVLITLVDFTFSSFRSLPVCKNSSIFSAILAPTPSFEKSNQDEGGDDQ